MSSRRSHAAFLTLSNLSAADAEVDPLSIGLTLCFIQINFCLLTILPPENKTKQKPILTRIKTLPKALTLPIAAPFLNHLLNQLNVRRETFLIEK